MIPPPIMIISETLFCPLTNTSSDKILHICSEISLKNIFGNRDFKLFEGEKSFSKRRFKNHYTIQNEIKF